VSVEDADHLDRVADLRAVPAAVRFLSCEPLLAPLPGLDLDGIGWVIAGGESGPNARPMHPDWPRALREQCAAQQVPFFFKQWGGRTPTTGGRLLDGRTHDAMPTTVHDAGQHARTSGHSRAGGPGAAAQVSQ
jgi:protein gp37